MFCRNEMRRNRIARKWGLTGAEGNFTLDMEFMPDTPNPPGGAVPPRPAEAAKVQPKKETVRINLPPKPTSAPTIKLPTLAPGGPPPAAAHAAPVAAAAPAAPAAAPAAPKAPTPPSSGAPVSRVAAAAPVVAAAPRPAPAPAAAPRPIPVARISGMDLGLAIAAGILALASAGLVAWLAFFVNTPSPT